MSPSPICQSMFAVVVTLTTIACAPPPPITLPPSITLAHPRLENGDVYALQCLPNPGYDCTQEIQLNTPYSEQLSMIVAVDIDGISLTDPYVEELADVPGQGHWHATLDALAGFSPSTERSVEITANAGQLQLGNTRLSVSLQDNTHDDLGPTDVVEFVLVSAAIDCTTLVEDYCP